MKSRSRPGAAEKTTSLAPGHSSTSAPRATRPASTCFAARRRLDERAEGYPASVDLFRRKATLVALLNEHLDELDSHRAKSYMTCRAVLAAKIDFDATDDNHNFNRGEAKRRAEQFFRIEASVGMD